LVKAASDDAASARTADLSRHHRVTDHGSGLITVTGGKLTTYREMAEDTVDAVVRRLPGAVTRAECSTKKLRLLGATRRPLGAKEGTTAGHLYGRYGSDADKVQSLIAADPSLGQPLVPGLAYLRAEAIYAVRHEMASTLDDILTRRTRARLFQRDAALAAAAEVARLVAPELGWDHAETERQIAEFTAACAAEVSAADFHTPAN
jgi:glycerol-3-phosphate dehydrogenase